MISDDDLHALADLPVGPPRGPRPVADVLARGSRLRRRRRAVRAAGMTAVVGTVAATGTLVLVGGDGSRGDVRTAPSEPGTTAPEPPTLYADPLSCLGSDTDEPVEIVEPTPIPPAEVRDAVRVLPAWTPDGIPITTAQGLRDEIGGGECDPATAIAQETLLLTATAGGVTRGTIELEGPYSNLAGPGTMGVDHSPTQVRGNDGDVVDPTHGDDTILEWTEPDGSAWRLWGVGADEATLRAVADALQLDASPDDGVPPAQITPDDLPAGYEIEEQATTVPPRYEPDEDGALVRWTVVAGTPSARQTGNLCQLTVEDRGEGVATDLPSAVGSERVTVGGRPGVWTSLMGGADFEGADRWRELWWEVAPGVVATADCTFWDGSGGRTLPFEEVLRFAESVEPVAADDPRIPDPPAEPAG